MSNETKTDYACRIWQYYDYTQNLIDIGDLVIDYLCKLYNKEQLRLLCEEAEEGCNTSAIDGTKEFAKLR